MTGRITVYVDGKLYSQFENTITYGGERNIAKSIADGSKVEWLAITDNTTPPTKSDVYNDFFDPATDKIFHERRHIKPFARGKTIVFEFLVGLSTAIFTWEKIGLVTNNGALYATQLFNFAGKTSTNTVNIIWELNT